MLRLTNTRLTTESFQWREFLIMRRPRWDWCNPPLHSGLRTVKLIIKTWPGALIKNTDRAAGPECVTLLKPCEVIRRKGLGTTLISEYSFGFLL